MIQTIKVALGSLGILLSLSVIIVILVSRLDKQFLYRLVMYLTVVN